MVTLLAVIAATRPALLRALDDPPRPEVGADAADVEAASITPEVRTV
jgi:hypothetical protein